MSASLRTIVVDDTSPLISWTGPWSPTAGVTDEIGYNGAPYLHTLHGININGSLSFSFEGVNVIIGGTLRPYSAGVLRDPWWQCLLDGRDITIPNATYPAEGDTKYLFCQTAAPDLPNGNHTIQLNAIIQTATLWVDFVQYQAGPSVEIADNWLQAPNYDSRIAYSGSGWTGTDSASWASLTYTTGASLTYDFIGNELIWGGYTPLLPTANATAGIASYTIDGIQPPTSFVIPARAGVWHNQPFFNITGLKPGQHRLTVTNGGNSSTAALGVQVIYTRTSPNGESTPGLIPFSTLDSPSDPTPKRKSTKAITVGGAVGGVVGAVLVVALAAVVVQWYRRRQRRLASRLDGSDTRVEGFPSFSKIPLQEPQHTGGVVMGPRGRYMDGKLG